MKFKTRCIDASNLWLMQAIDNMVKISEKITQNEFKANVDIKELEEMFQSYAWADNEKGMRFWDDVEIEFYKSRYCGQNCVYLINSAIEYVFI